MQDIIQLLPDKIANQIAAGEVIQRPASVVKELLENALDAGSTKIQLIAKDAGKALIQVVDNGIGMSVTDARMCFERHATSKITTIEDLFALKTKGFRGEAMASIGAIAQVELKTKRAEDNVGTQIKIEGSKVLSQEACQQPTGTSIAVKNLFFNVPARRNFLKSNPVETKHIIDEFLRIVLAHPNVAFTLHHNNSEIYHLNEANLRQRIVAVFGSNYNEKLVPVSENTDYVKVNGFIGKPESAKKTRGEQYFFLNGRFIKNAYLNHAVTSAYENILHTNTFPFYILNIDIDPAAVDINVHPTKQEVKFEDERIVYMIVQAAVKHGLAQYSITPSIDFNQEASFKDFEAFRSGFSSNSNPIKTDTYVQVDQTNSFAKTSTKGWENAFEKEAKPFTFEPDIMDTVTIPSKGNDELELPFVEEVTSIFTPIQIHKTYILTQIKSGIIFIHQHLAHQRILYEQYLAAFERKTGCQKLLFPKTIEFNSSDTALFEEIINDVRLLGFDIENFGKNSFIVSGVPTDLTNEHPEQIIENMLEQYKWSAAHDKIPQRENIARSLARYAAIPAGKSLLPSLMKALIDQLFGCEQPNVTAYGQPTFIQYSLSHLKEEFGLDD
ncbi:MAG: DNA mismatch repair endonuclease MutL [Chitinophagales bacterium]